MAPKPLESRIQDLVYNVDAGIGLRLIKTALYFLFVGFVVLLYTANQFRGLRDAEAMEYAQLGRNLAQHQRYITQNVRPASIWYLTRGAPEADPRIHNHPELVHAPLYPALLGVMFRGVNFSATPEGPLQIFNPEYRIMVMNHIFALLTGLLLYLLGRRLFDPRVALLGVSIYFLSNSVWRDSLSGTGVTVAAFFGVAAFYAMSIAVTRLEESDTTRRWWLPAIVAALACVLAFLTRYAAIALVPGLALYLGWALKRRWWGALWFVAVFVVGISPWLARNVAVSGSPLGLAPYMAFSETESFPDNAFERSLSPSVGGEAIRSLRWKMTRNALTFYNEHLRTMGEGLLMAIFLTTFFYRFVRPSVHTLRWCLALSLALFFWIGTLYGEATLQFMAVFWPFVILYALAFFMLLLERLQLGSKLLNRMVTGALVFLTAAPMIITLMPPRALPPYPPYSPGIIAYVSNLLSAEEIMCTDMPAATAWYGQRTSVLLPYNVEQFYDINDYLHRFSGLYITMVTRNKPYVGTLRGPAYASWFPILEGRLPSDFPLTQGIPLRDMDMIFLSDRARWAE